MRLKYIPNSLSALRILMVPVFIYLFFEYFDRIYLSLAIFLLAGVTDIIDGYLARRNNWTTNLGKMLDPLADKLMQCTVLVCFAVKDIIPWQLAAIFMLKEVFMISGALIVLKKIKVTVKSKWYGKATTTVFYATAFSVFAVHVFYISVNAAVAVILFALVLLFTLVSMILYIIDTLRINADLKNKEEQEINKI